MFGFEKAEKVFFSPVHFIRVFYDPEHGLLVMTPDGCSYKGLERCRIEPD
jgi:hypothetical protein